MAGTYISKICVATVLRHARRLATEASDSETEATIQNRFQKLSGLKEVFPDAGEFLWGALEAELSRDRGQLDGLDHVMNSARGLWELESHRGQTHSLFDDFCV